MPREFMGRANQISAPPKYIAPTGVTFFQNVGGIHECPANLWDGRIVIRPYGSALQIPIQKGARAPF